MPITLGDIEMDAVEEWNKREFYVRLRCRNARRLRLATLALALAIRFCHMLGVGVRLVDKGRLVVPHRVLMALLHDEWKTP